MGIIRRSSSPYASPITVVMKKDKTMRLCIDFRRLNSLTIFDAEPIPTLEELLAKMKGAHFFFKKKGFGKGLSSNRDGRELQGVHSFSDIQRPDGIQLYAFWLVHGRMHVSEGYDRHLGTTSLL
ncbi:transposon Ty3-I Gag-Pol polyprotein [Elysia marginata]|uniref:Transposon Ty3-I Gag-Pol polyprotein n=1 Tax=Elysia marginata TaxID=1093978 RepID=A0AAV4GBQ3_9GAST|nr:transposon Ty3-I Gag-Pol polyprotein [Elysia marginata]